MNQINVTQLDAVLHRGAILVDVREPMEFAQAHVPGALLIPMGQLPSRLAEFDKVETIYLICATGNRSSAMTDLLIAQGYDAVNVAGGTTAWLQSGRTTTSGLAGAQR